MRINIDSLTPIKVARHYDGAADVIEFDVGRWIEAYPALTEYRVEVTSPGGAVYLPESIVLDGHMLKWTIMPSDTGAAGDGEYQIVATGANGERKTSASARFVVREIMEGTAGETPPDPAQPWVEKVLDAARKVEDATVHPPVIGENGNWWLWDFDAAAYVDSGKPSRGSDSGGGGIVQETDPTVPAWAKQPKKPTYTAEEVGAASVESVAKLSEEIAKQRSEKPFVYIDGEIPTTKDNVFATMTVKSGWLNIFAYIKIKCQGSSSMDYPKKNFTVTLYQDEARTIPLEITIPGWKHASNKFVLKANYIDHLHARNIISARLWSEIVASRPDYDTLPGEFRNSPNNGAVDGFPIIVYANGAYQGLYTWNIGKEDWLWDMDEGNPNHVLMCAETNTNGVYAETACNFRALWNGVDESNWSVEVGKNSEAVKNALNALISCVKDTTDDEFVAQIENYLDIQSAIDYYIFACADCGIDSLGKNILLGTYDLHKWIMGAYDLDSTWGLWWSGSKFIPSTTVCPDDYQERYSLLFERIEKLFSDRMTERARELRQTVLSEANILTHFERFADEIGEKAYSDDLIVYQNIPSAASNNIWQIRNFVKDRMDYFDRWIRKEPAEEPVEALYTLPSGTYTDNAATLTISEDNHVVVTVDGGEIFASLAPEAVEVTSGSGYTVEKSGWFTLNAGDVVRRVIKNVVVDGDTGRFMSQNIASNRGEEKFENNITLSDLGTMYESTKAFTSSCDVGGLILWVNAGNARLTVEFDIELYVNGERYI